jgi:hypothetical protein
MKADAADSKANTMKTNLTLLIALAVSTSCISNIYMPPVGGTADGDGDGDESSAGDGDGEASDGETCPGDGDGDPGDGDGDDCPLGSDGCPCDLGGGCLAPLVCVAGACTPASGDGDVDPVCNTAFELDFFGGWTYYKVPVIGVMSDDNVAATCWSCNLDVPCAGPNGCFTDNLCGQTDNELCNAPLAELSGFLCGSSYPDGCEPLFGAYQYMGHEYVNESSIGVEMGVFPVYGLEVENRFALCVRD